MDSIPTRPGVITCKRATDILIYVKANYPDHAARADGYGNRWVVTITSTADPDYLLRRLYAHALPLMVSQPRRATLPSPAGDEEAADL